MNHRYLHKNADKTVLVLHGMGGSNEDMLDLAELITPHHNALFIEGEDFSTGMRRYFKRSQTGLDLVDLKTVALQMAEEIRTHAITYQFDVNQVDVFGFSNGANMFLGMILLNCFPFRRGVAFRPSYVDLASDSNNTSLIRIHCGEQDPYLSLSEAKLFAQKFDDRKVQLDVYPGGHQITKADIEDAQRFLNL